MAELIQTYIDGAYTDFKTLVADARRLKPEQIEAVAQGRVWSGQDALRHGLVDRLGGLNDAVAAAAARAGLGDKPRVVYLDAERSRWQRLLGQFDWAGMSWLRGLLPQALGSADGPALPAVWSGTAEGTALLSAASSQGVGAGASLGAFGVQGALAALSGLATAEPGLDLLLLLHGSWTAAAQGSLPAVQAHCLCTVP